MKKFALVLASLLILGGVTANAQGVVVKGGYNYANVSIDKNVTVKDIKAGRSGWQIGVGYQTDVASGFSFQPELVYKVSGYRIDDVKDLRLGYLDIPLNLQWGPDLVIARPFIFAGPYVGIKVQNQFKGSNWTETDIETIKNGLKKAEFGLGIGIGINFWKLQIAGKYNWNFGAIANAGKVDYTTLQGKPRTFEISVGLIF